jgi:hypothetical protein
VRHYAYESWGGRDGPTSRSSWVVQAPGLRFLGTEIDRSREGDSRQMASKKHARRDRGGADPRMAACFFSTRSSFQEYLATAWRTSWSGQGLVPHSEVALGCQLGDQLRLISVPHERWLLDSPSGTSDLRPRPPRAFTRSVLWCEDGATTARSPGATRLGHWPRVHEPWHCRHLHE